LLEDPRIVPIALALFNRGIGVVIQVALVVAAPVGNHVVQRLLRLLHVDAPTKPAELRDGSIQRFGGRPNDARDEPKARHACRWYLWAGDLSTDTEQDPFLKQQPAFQLRIYSQGPYKKGRGWRRRGIEVQYCRSRSAAAADAASSP
jgi:hypothetical protein